MAALDGSCRSVRAWRPGGAEHSARGPRTRCDNERVDAAATIDVDGTRLAELCRRYGVAELAVFGSVARGEATDESDVDLLYVLEPGSQLGFGINDLEDELAALFGRPVDLVSKRTLHRLLRDQVLSDARTLYAA